jgi:SpoVK/Ycf46/Vps4 family AAA+-type ATPase
VDSLLNARRSDVASNTHREIVNQFMVEWDGLSSDNHGVILMAATNRPYDLDDAVLRRMPRRILGMMKKFLIIFPLEVVANKHFAWASGLAKRN